MSKSIGKEIGDQAAHVGVSAVFSAFFAEKVITGAVLGFLFGFVREHGQNAKKHGHIAFLWNDIRTDDGTNRLTPGSIFKGTRLDMIGWTVGGALGLPLRLGVLSLWGLLCG